MAYKSTYHEDSDADDEYERSVITSPTLPPDFESSPTDSEPPSTEHTPTTFTHSGGSHHGSPKGLITDWTADQCADFVSTLGLAQYADTFVDEGIIGEALIALNHAELKEMGMGSVGHRLTVLKGVYEVKAKQNIPIDPDHYIPLSADTGAQDVAPTADDITRIIHIIQERDQRIATAEAELRALKDDLNRVSEENRRLREDLMPVFKMAKDRSQPLPTPAEVEHATSPPVQQERSGSSLSRKFSTKKLFLSSAPKNPSPTIQEGRTLTDASSLDPSAAAIQASSHLAASMNASSQSANSPNQFPQPSPTSPAYSTQSTITSAPRSYSRADSRAHDHHDTWNSTYSTASTVAEARELRNPTPAPLSSRALRTPAPEGSNGPPSGGLGTPAAASTPGSGGSQNPQVEIFKSFRVSIDDPCHKVLPAALKKYNINADWRQYALYIVHGDQERCLGLDEKPLILFKQLDKEGRKPMFMLRKHTDAPPTDMSRSGAGPSSAQGGFESRGNWAGGAVQLPGGVL